MFVISSLAASIMCLTGCSAMRFGIQQTPPTQPQAAAPQEKPLTPEAKEMQAGPPNEATIAAIEEFLERTRGYAGSTNAPEQKPDAPAAGSAPVRVSETAYAQPPAVALKPSVNVSTVTTSQSAATTRPAYDWNQRRVATTDPVPAAGQPQGYAAAQPQGYGGATAPVPPARPAAATQLASQRIQSPPPAPVEAPATLALPVLQSVTVHVPAVSDEEPPAEAGMSNIPVEVVQEPTRPTWRTLIEDLTDQAQTTDNALAFWRLGLARLASDQRGLPAPDMSRLSMESRSLLESFFQVADALRSFIMDPVSGGAGTLDRVESLHRIVAASADPVVSSVALCRRVTTFGVYDEMGPTDVVAGRSTQAIVYCELDNLRAEQKDDGRFETRLSTRIEVLTSGGVSVWTHEEPEIVDRCRRQRRDFFLAQRLTFPPTLPAGEYVLKVLVEDSLSGRTNEAIKPFTISSALSLANSGK